MTTYIIAAAGGNATAIRVLDKAQERSWYEREGRTLMQGTESRGVEQAGFLIPSEGHFEMAGGEFCGNAARSAALLMARLTGDPMPAFTMSGCKGTVQGTVDLTDDGMHGTVRCAFPNLPVLITQTNVLGGTPATIVDLGGIVHVLVQQPFPRNDYQRIHREITRELNLSERAAVGVCWYEDDGEIVRIEPVVWVRGIDSFFHETSCGSASISVACALHREHVQQPSGQFITVTVGSDFVALSSKMEVTHVADASKETE